MAQRETTVKQQRLEQFVELHDLDGVLLQHRPNFAWITNGRDNIPPASAERMRALAVSSFVNSSWRS